MSKRDVLVGIDVGSSTVKTIIAQIISPEEKPRIIGVGVAPSAGVRKGIIVDLEEATQSINRSLEEAERLAGVSVNRAVVSVGGNHIFSQYSKGVIAVGRADGEVTEDDVERVINAAQAISIPPNKEIIHIIPKDYSLDDQRNIKDPIGMNGVRLEVDACIIEGSTPYLRNLTKCVEQAGVAMDSFVLAPLAAARATLSKRQKELGVVLVDIGGGATSLAVFEENDLLHTAIVPLGGNHITNDIAIGLRTSIDVAEKVKINYGSALPDDINKKDHINLAEIDPNEEGEISRHHVAEIIEARLEEIFTMIDKELRKTGRSGMLPAGALIVGGGAKLPGVVDLAKKVLRLPAQTGFPLELGGIVDKVDEPGFVTAVGLALWGMEEMAAGSGKGRISAGIDSLPKMGQTVDKMKGWLRKFLP